MNVVMTHFIHGAKVAISEQEVLMDEQNGWVRYTAATPEASVAEPAAQVVKRKYTRRANPGLYQPTADESEE